MALKSRCRYIRCNRSREPRHSPPHENSFPPASSSCGPNALNTFGFLTVVETETHSLFGGLLLLNSSGRPTEFHCTAPVQPNRAQEILYGMTLRPYLFTEVIGRTLFESAKTPPLVAFVDVPLMLGIRPLVDLPLLYVDGANEKAEPDRADSFAWEGQTLAVDANYPNDRETARSLWEHHACQFELAEPFDRIREAIEEAQRTAA